MINEEYLSIINEIEEIFDYNNEDITPEYYEAIELVSGLNECTAEDFHSDLKKILNKLFNLLIKTL